MRQQHGYCHFDCVGDGERKEDDRPAESQRERREGIHRTVAYQLGNQNCPGGKQHYLCESSPGGRHKENQTYKNSIFNTGCSSITLGAAPVAPCARSKNPTPVMRAGVGLTAVWNVGICTSSPSAGVRKDSGIVKEAIVGRGKSPDTEFRGTSFLPPGGKMKSRGESVWTNLSSTFWRASWMFCCQGLLLPIKAVVG